MLSDFGLSSLLVTSRVASVGTGPQGSARWMAIEFYTQLQGFSGSGAVMKANEKTDVWAFGMTVYVSSD
jgi:serine/threonine protein kinase